MLDTISGPRGNLAFYTNSLDTNRRGSAHRLTEGFTEHARFIRLHDAGTVPNKGFVRDSRLRKEKRLVSLVHVFRGRGPKLPVHISRNHVVLNSRSGKCGTNCSFRNHVLTLTRIRKVLTIMSSRLCKGSI